MGINGGARNTITVTQIQRSGNRNQKLNAKGKKSTLTTCGGIQLKERGSTASRSGVEEILGNFHAGDLNIPKKYNFFSLNMKEKSALLKTLNEYDGGDMSTCVIHVVDINHAATEDDIIIDEPPDSTRIIRNKFTFPSESSIPK